MHRLVLTLDSPAENLALDEALLDEAEDGHPDWECLRLWEPPRPLVVVGRSSRVDQEVDLAACAVRGIPVLRRSSGGAAIVAGPGCLMYAVVLSYRLRPELQAIGTAHRWVLAQLAAVLRDRFPSVAQAGTSDLAILAAEAQKRPQAEELLPPGTPGGGSASSHPPLRKFSGNSLRAKRTHCLYHGTLLYDFELPLISACLQMPARQPVYRDGRPHTAFVANLPISRDALQRAVLEAFPTEAALDPWPRDRTVRLATERYQRDDWNLAYGRPTSG